MSFKTETECPRCGGQLKIDYEHIGYVTCESCGGRYTIDEVSQYAHQSTSAMFEKSDAIYNKEKYAEALTTKNIENLNNDALVKRMKVALITERYAELRQYIDELIRREPDNYLAYEYALLSRYRVVRLEDLVNVEDKFYESDTYRIYYRVADQFKRQELDTIVKQVKARVEAKEKERNKKEKDEAKKVNTRNKLMGFLSVLPAIMAVVGALVMFISAPAGNFLLGSGGYTALVTGWVFYTIAAIIFTVINCKKYFEENEVNKITIGIGSGLAAICFIVTLIGSIRLIGLADIGNKFTITASHVVDGTSYGSYDTTVYMTVTNDSLYDAKEIGAYMSFYNKSTGKSLGSWNVYFRGNYSSKASNATSVTFSSSSSALYDASFEEMEISYRITYLKSEEYGITEFTVHGDTKYAKY